ncbi:RNA polymerase sigma factor RpoH [Alphaproteobacteria bacterium]|nr:RNA polymerase sigma factor RpoH [Alphaproteobacteria bacterium]MDB4106547.1 RNA polymerase sigma factor RpoH [bacterium]MDC0148539.1 RNA polymerase sigma factor RpoH [Alphaproteobacteria bacterium]MDC1241041.1 RNA polymerase sigma factor RpoH [bacterium]
MTDKKLPVTTSTALAPAPSPEGSLSRYLTEIRKYPMLEAQEEYDLATEYAEKGSVKSAHKLVTSHLRLVAKIAMGYRGYGLPIGEIISEGNVGLMQAVKKFDAERGFRLATYAMWWIRASIQEYILRSWSLVKIGTTAAQKKLFFNLRRIKGEINAIDGGQLKPDQVSEIATQLGVRESEVVSMDGRLSTGDQSLNAPIKADGADGDQWQDWLEDESDNQETVLVENDELQARHEVLMLAMSELNEREQEILQARRLQDEPATLEELSQKHGVSRERIRQIEGRAFEKLRKSMTQQAAASGLIDANIIDAETS